MDAYTGFAEVYDLFMDDIPYAEWCGYLAGLLEEYGIQDGLVADLGCGTGKLTRLLAGRGYDMIGIDLSGEMLEIAREKSGPEEILYLMQDMREFELYGTVRAAVSVCDSVNYILEEQELCQVFALVNNYLDPGGIFLFDFNTDYKYREILGDRTIAEDREDCAFIWDNFYDEEERINEYGLTLFIRRGAEGGPSGQGESLSGDGPFWRFQETHYQKGYTLEEIQAALQHAGMEFLGAWDADTKGEPHGASERIYAAARERGKTTEHM